MAVSITKIGPGCCIRKQPLRPGLRPNIRKPGIRPNIRPPRIRPGIRRPIIPVQR